jgi:prepilin-type processing-associated H-X9-DG protein
MKLNSARSQPTPESAAYARQELLAMVGIILLIILVQAPLLARNHGADPAARCRDNLRQLILAWQMYSSDNQGELVPNRGNAFFEQTWVTGSLDFTSSYDNLHTDYLINSQKTEYYGLLGPYVRDASIFRCPADTSTVVIFGRSLKRSRTVSMNNWMAGTNVNGQSDYRVFLKQSDISAPTPSQAWVIQDEREDSINDSRFEVDMEQTIAAYPGSYHGGGGYLAYADGHVAHQVWQDPRTNPELIKGINLPLDLESPDNADLDWLRARTTVLK